MLNIINLLSGHKHSAQVDGINYPNQTTKTNSNKKMEATRKLAPHLIVMHVA